MYRQEVEEASIGPVVAPSTALVGVVRVADIANEVVGKVVAWMVLGTVLVCFASVYARYALGVSFVWLQEIYIYQHAAVIVLGSGYTMMTGGFVRVDLFYAKWSARRRALMDMLMTIILLFPFMIAFGWFAWRFSFNSFLADEGSLNPGGLPDLWILKGTFLVFTALVMLQGLAICARGLLVLNGHERYVLPHAGHDPAPAS